MATALERLYPGVRFATGPATEQGFFYDIRTDNGLKLEDLERIQAEMSRVVAEEQRFEVASVPKPDAYAFFDARGQTLKGEILDRIPDETVTLYRNGEYVDLCAGPHAPSTICARHAKLLGVAAAHWRRELKPSLTRVSGTAWENEKMLEDYLRFLEETKARDHRTLGPRLDLFSFHPWAASALWHPKGLVLKNELLAVWRELMTKYEYQEVLNPILYQKELFECSGHWEHFQEDMFVLRDDEGQPTFVLKPMNCPDTMLFFLTRTRSYRELPLRIAEGQVLHRNEPTGALHGLMRTRNFVQDDAHIFLTPAQVEPEIGSLLEMLDWIYGLFGLEYSMRLSTKPESSMGRIEVWDAAERGLRSALEHAGRDYVVDEGKGAFYGPKIDFQVKDSLGRQWQCGTIQLDFQLPERFDLKYTDADGSLQRPIVIHRALFGSFERFIGVVIEHFAGALPTWLAPVQAVVLPVSERQSGYAREVHERLKGSGVRAEVMHEDPLNHRIRSAELLKIPYILVVGDRETEARTVSVRQRKAGKLRTVGLDAFGEELREAIRGRVLDVSTERGQITFKAALGEGTEDNAY